MIHLSQIYRKKKGGFTLVEALVSMALVGLILSLLISLSTQSINAIHLMETSKTRRQSAREILNLISRDLQGALFSLDPTNLRSFQLLANPSFLDPNIFNRDALFWQTTSPTDYANGDVVEVGYFIRWVMEGESHRPILCRFYVTPNEETEYQIIDNPEGWINSSLIDTVAPANASGNYKGFLADNVIALWIDLDQKQNHTNNRPSLMTSFDSRKNSARLASALVSLVVISRDLLDKINGEMEKKIKRAYSKASPEEFLKSLSPLIQKNTRIFSTRVTFENSP